MMRWLVFMDDCYASRWLRLDGDAVVARGDDLAAIPTAGGEDLEISAIVSGTSVVTHWVELPALAPAQAAAAARLLAADVCGGGIDAVHVVLGGIEVDGARPLALVDKAVMHAWLASLAASGIVPDRIVPLPMLVANDVGAAGPAFAAVLTIGDIAHVRGHRLALSAEVPLAELMLAGREPVTVDQRAFEARVAASLADATIDLRQGEFGPARHFPLDRRRLRRISLLVATAAGLWLATEVTALLRDSFAADRAEQQVADAARAVLPRGTAIDAPRAQVAARAEQLGAAGHGLTALAAPLLAAMRDRAGLSLQSLRYTPDAGLKAVVAVPNPADAAGLADALRSPDALQGSEAITIGAVRVSEGMTVVDVTVRPK